MSKKKNEKKFFHGFRATAAEEISSQTNTATAVLLASSSSTAECVVVKRESSSIQSDPVCRTEQSIFPISLPPSAGSSLYTFPPIVPFFSSFLKCSSDKREQSAISFLPLQVNEGFFFSFSTDWNRSLEAEGGVWDEKSHQCERIQLSGRGNSFPFPISGAKEEGKK